MKALVATLVSMMALPAVANAQVVQVIPTTVNAEIDLAPSVAPPALQAEAIPVSPGAGYTWVPGYWQWDGNQYIWSAGFWDLPPAVGAVYTAPRWSYAGNKWQFASGGWYVGQRSVPWRRQTYAYPAYVRSRQRTYVSQPARYAPSRPVYVQPAYGRRPVAQPVYVRPAYGRPVAQPVYRGGQGGHGGRGGNGWGHGRR